MAPTPVSTAKIRRQEPTNRIPAPSVGAISGATLNTSETAARCRRASRPSNRSRMIARGRMPTAPALAPCTRRKASSASIEGASAAARRAEREQGEADEHDRLAAEPVGERADHDRRGREAGDEDRDRRRRFRLRRMEIGLDQRQARQRHVDRQRRQGRERGEKEREAEPDGRWSGSSPARRRARVTSGAP